MSRVQFIIVTTLAGVVALCILLEIVFAKLSASDDNRLRNTGEALQEGQADFGRLQQIATRVAQLAQQQNDQSLKDLLARNNIQINNTQDQTNAPAPAATAPAAPAPSTH